jgi:hypothetical protein
MKTALIALAVAPWAWGQLVIVRPADESPVPGLLDVGAAAPGDFLDTRLRVRNTGTAAATLSVLRISGTGFTVEGTPPLPFLMAPGVNADFRVRFRPAGPGSFSATLQANSTSLLVRGTATAGIALLRDGVRLTNERPIEFGTVTAGERGRIGLLLRNESAQDLTVRQLTLAGSGFSLSPVPLPWVLRGGEEAALELVCEPTRAGLMNGTLQLDGRTFNVVALAREPEAPDALIELDATAARSGRQSSLRIRLATPAVAAVTGTLRIEFTPSVDARPGDSAIQFLANSSRTVSVQAGPGDTSGLVAGKAAVAFQTGTTAGTAVFRLTLGTREREVAVTIPPEAPMIELVELRRSPGSVDVILTGFDNHRSAGNAVFVFTDVAGLELPAVSAEAGSAFKQFFSESPMGGLFRLTARFPVTGDSARLGRVAVRLANGVGVGTGRSE